MIKFIVILIISTMLLGCKGVLTIKASGEISSPTFTILDDTNIIQSIPIRTIIVDRYCLDNGKVESEQKWVTSNIDSLEAYYSSIVYAQSPKGFVEQYKATKLKENELYYVQVDALQYDADGLFMIKNINGKKIMVNMFVKEGITFEDWVKKQPLYIKCN